MYNLLCGSYSGPVVDAFVVGHARKIQLGWRLHHFLRRLTMHAGAKFEENALHNALFIIRYYYK